MSPKDWVILFFKKYEERYGERCEIPKSKWGKYCRQFKVMSSQHEEETLRAMVTHFFTVLGVRIPYRLGDLVDLFHSSLTTLKAEVLDERKAQAKSEQIGEVWERLQKARRTND